MDGDVSGRSGGSSYSSRSRRGGNLSWSSKEAEGEIYKRSEQPNAKGIQQWRCIKHSEGCKMVIDTNRADLCVGKSKTRHSHCTLNVAHVINYHRNVGKWTLIRLLQRILSIWSYRLCCRIAKMTCFHKLGEDFTNLFDMLKSIAYVPIDDVSSAYDAVMTQCARNSDKTEKWDRDLMFLQVRQISKDFRERSFSSNRHGLFIKLSGPQDARLVFERFHGRKFYGVIAVASYISENEYFASRRIF
uniref:RRM domain-containing protein n=1 Tax=Ditylenchus dipsaci TaxID=166011 RepID=A0A915DPH4_9BILA